MKETELILQCNANSYIEQVIYWKGEFDPSVLQNQPLLFCLAPESLEAGKNFFDSIRLAGKAENVPLSLILAGEIHPFLFSGAKLNNHILVIAQHASLETGEKVTKITQNMISEEVEASLEMPDAPQES